MLLRCIVLGDRVEAADDLKWCYSQRQLETDLRRGIYIRAGGGGGCVRYMPRHVCAL